MTSDLRAEALDVQWLVVRAKSTPSEVYMTLGKLSRLLSLASKRTKGLLYDDT